MPGNIYETHIVLKHGNLMDNNLEQITPLLRPREHHKLSPYPPSKPLEFYRERHGK